MSQAGRFQWFSNYDLKFQTAEVSLVCVHHAGGLASIFNSWRGYFAGRMDLLPVMFPGRGMRYREPAVADLAELSARVVSELERLPWRRIALFGDCSGAIVALALAKMLRQSDRTRAGHLFAAGLVNPCAVAPDPRHKLGDSDFRAWALREKLIPEGLLTDPNATDLFLRQIKTDFQLIEMYRDDGSLLECPISTFVGAQDRLAPISFAAWGKLTRGPWSHHFIDSDHLASIDLRHELKSVIASSHCD